MLSAAPSAKVIDQTVSSTCLTPCIRIRHCHRHNSSRAPNRQYGRQQANLGSKAVVSGGRAAFMACSVTLPDSSVRQVIAASLTSSVGVAQHSWSEEFVVEFILSEITCQTISSSTPDSNSSDSERQQVPGAYDSRAGTAAAAAGHLGSPYLPASSTQMSAGQRKRQISSSRQTKAAKPVQSTALAHNSFGSNNNSSSAEVALAVDVAELLDAYMAADGDDGGSSSDGGNCSGGPANGIEDWRSRFSQLLYDNYQQVEEEDCASFSNKLLHQLAALVRTALASQCDDAEGLCELCGRDMPLTKHHLIPRDVHKEFKKRGYTFAQLQCGVMICRPCHSAIHRSVPDNKQLALQYNTLEALAQHEEIAKFAAWASKQRVSSKAGTRLKHHRYRR